MNSAERIEAALAGAEVDRPPFSFWYNFGLQHMSGEAIADAHIAFARRFCLDYVRVISGYPYPLDGMRSFDRPNDLLNVPIVNAEDKYWGHQLRALEKISKKLKDSTWVIDSVDSPWTVLCRLASTELVLRTARQRPEIVRAALNNISISQVNYVKKAVNTGIKGIFFTITEASYDALDPISHEEICKPCNNMILEAASELPFNVLRIEGNRPYFDTLKGKDGYKTQAVSWSHFRAKQGLVKGILEWNRSVLGGINHDTLAEETPNNLRAYFEKYAEYFFVPRVIIAPSGVLPSNISPYVLDGVVSAIDNLKLVGRLLKPESTKIKSASKRAGVEEYYREKKGSESDYSHNYDSKVPRYRRVYENDKPIIEEKVIKTAEEDQETSGYVPVPETSREVEEAPVALNLTRADYEESEPVKSVQERPKREKRSSATRERRFSTGERTYRRRDDHRDDRRDNKREGFKSKKESKSSRRGFAGSFDRLRDRSYQAKGKGFSTSKRGDRSRNSGDRSQHSVASSPTGVRRVVRIYR
ncbi:hypothetical protein IJT10_06305 [bacterium]|nr:hypothetical protein [bacterium]